MDPEPNVISISTSRRSSFVLTQANVNRSAGAIGHVSGWRHQYDLPIDDFGLGIIRQCVEVFNCRASFCLHSATSHANLSIRNGNQGNSDSRFRTLAVPCCRMLYSRSTGQRTRLCETSMKV